MNLGTQSSGLAGEPNDWDCAQFYEFKPDDDEQVSAMGEMFTIVGVNIDRNHGQALRDSLISTGKDLVFALQQRYFVSSNVNTLENIKGITSSVIQEFSKGKNIQLGLAVKKEDVVYLVCYGGAKICLFRQGLLAPILKSEGGKLVSASGYMHGGDVLLLGTTTFFHEFEGGRLRASLGSANIGEVVERLAPMVHSKESSGDIASLLIGFDEKSLFSNQVFIDKSEVNVQPKNLAFKLRNGLKGVLKKSLYVKRAEDDEESSKRRRVFASVGMILLFLLVVSIFFGIKQKKQQDFKKNYEQDLASAKHSLEESENLQNLDPERSRELFLDAKGKVLGLSADINDPEVLDLKKKVEEKQGEILGEYQKDVQLFVDLGLLSDGFSGTDFVLTQDYIYVLDSVNKRIIKVSVSSKRAEVVVGPSKIDEASSLTAYLDNIYILNSRGLFDVTNQNTKKVIDKTWQGAVMPFSYAGNIYLLERDTSKVWRYSGSDGEFGLGKEWLSESTTSDLTSSISWAIDGNIWILTAGGKIYKFALGNQQPFALGGNYVSDDDLDYIFTGDGVDNLYLLDRKNSRVLVFDKEGKYKAQYINENISQTTQIVVSEKEGKIILLNENKLYSIDLSN